MLKTSQAHVHYEKLRKKYRIKICKDTSPESPLYPILLKMEQKKDLSEVEIKWLEAEEYFVFLGNYYSWTYKRFSNTEHLKKATYYYELKTSRSKEPNELFAAKVEMTKEIHDLFEKYDIPPQSTNFKNLKLWEILRNFDKDKTLEPNDLAWLEEHKFYSILGHFYKIEFNVTKELWSAIKAGKYFRKAKLSKQALEVTEGLVSEDIKIQAAILTNRGGAYRDLSQLDEAMKNAEEALQLQPKSYYPCNLLGAILYQQGFPEEGDEYFRKAILFGSPIKVQDNFIRSALKDAGDEERKVIARYLLNKDPEKYSWAKSYIKSDERI